VVIYGGASLAVYMHGVTKELIKLVRASKLLHEVGGPQAGAMNYAEGPDRRAPDTEAVYFDALQAINRDQHFRVVIDVIAGASAGAINGLMLAKALVDDGCLDAQTGLWLDGADSEQLATESVGRLRKWYLYPFLRLFSGRLLRGVCAGRDTRIKLVRRMRATWLRPPFSGERLCHLFLDGFEALAASRRPGSSLLPPDQQLDVYASLTDLAGYPRTIRLHQALVAREKEHAAFCRLSHPGRAGAPSDFRADNVPALVWAARASSSYAGAFPPFRHDELLRVLRSRNLPWPGEAQFLANNLRARDGTPAQRHFDPATRYFVDGGIVNNKPFGAVLEALKHRTADRQVHRRLLYIEPNPTVEDDFSPDRALGYLGTLRAAVSGIPRNQPILDELNTIVEQDARVQINQRIIDTHRPRVATMIEVLRRPHVGQPVTGQLVTYWRQALEDQADVELGLAYDAYVQRRVWRLVDTLSRAWRELGAVQEQAAMVQALEDALAEVWVDTGGQGQVPGSERAHRQQAFLEQVDVSYRIRRLQFLIRRINQFESDRALDPLVIEALGEFKQRVYGFSERCFALRHGERLDASLVGRILAAARGALPDGGALRELLGAVAEALALPALDREFDAELAQLIDRLPEARVRDGILADYLGFPLFDVLLLAPGAPDGDPDPLTPIRIERVSPADAHSLDGVFDGLRSRELMGFLGFFDRGHREHDYLWGRLNGAERLVDLLVDVAGAAIDNPRALKCALFEAILAAERSRLSGSQALLDRVAAAVARMS
jgi:patatin-related protein